MSEAIVITPVKDSPDTTRKTIEAICQSEVDVEYFVYNDFSKPETRQLLKELNKKLNFNLIHLEEITSNPSPNYKLVLETAQKKALQKGLPLLIIESDVVIQPETIRQLIEINNQAVKPGMVGAITVDKAGHYNFPYNFETIKNNKTVKTNRSLSFCCTLLSEPFLQSFNFNDLSPKKDWFDVTVSRKSKKMGFTNYLAKGIRVLHLPHSSRPWKNLKYSNPLWYYINKFIKKRDRI